MIHVTTLLPDGVIGVVPAYLFTCPFVGWPRSVVSELLFIYLLVFFGN